MTVTCQGAVQSTGEAVKTRRWYHIWTTYDVASNRLSVGQQALAHPFEKTQSTRKLDEPIHLQQVRQVLIAAFHGEPVQNHFNGKIESPMIFDRTLSEAEITDVNAQKSDDLQAHWDFSAGISSTRIEDVGPHHKHGRLINMPARAMTGSTWTGEEMCWQHAPEQYAAIHFHEDDIYDFDWETDFTFTIPDGLKPGVYAARLRCGSYEDSLPFFVCPPKGKPTADLCVLVSTFTYTIYGNHARPNFEPSWLDRIRDWNAYPWNPAVYPHYGCSTYNHQGGICFVPPGTISCGHVCGRRSVAGGHRLSDESVGLRPVLSRRGGL